MAVDHLGDFDVVIEPYAYFMNLYAERVTEPGGSLLKIFWNVNGDHRMMAAESGRTIRYREPPVWEQDQGDPLPAEAGLSFDLADNKWWFTTMRRSMITVLERTCGQPISRDWLLERPRPSWEISEPPQ